MALSLTAKKLVTVLGLTAGAVVLSKLGDETARPSRQKKKVKGKLEGVFEEGALLPDSVAEDLMLPINLSLQPRTIQTDMADIVGGAVNDPGQLDIIITDLTPEKAQMAYEHMLMLVRDQGYDLSNPSTKDEAIRRTVMIIAPRVDWGAGLTPYSFDSPEGLVWRGTQMLGEMAHQTFWNKQAALGA